MFDVDNHGGPYPGYGICYNWSKAFCSIVDYEDAEEDKCYHLVAELGASWVGSRNFGDTSECYPVPKSNFMWKGVGLINRISLMNHIHTCLEAKIVQKNSLSSL